MKRVLPLILLGLLACASARKPGGERPAFRRLSPAVAYELLRDNPDVLVLDLRPAAAFVSDRGHLRRARSAPLGQLAELLAELVTYREETVLAYCDTEACAAAGMELLAGAGFVNALLMEGGIDAWIRQGFKTELALAATERRGSVVVGRHLRPLRPGEVSAAAPEVETASAPPP
jgi:rhodanese-related sulfurtransferase